MRESPHSTQVVIENINTNEKEKKSQQWGKDLLSKYIIVGGQHVYFYSEIECYVRKSVIHVLYLLLICN